MRISDFGLSEDESHAGENLISNPHSAIRNPQSEVATRRAAPASKCLLGGRFPFKFEQSPRRLILRFEEEFL